MHSGALPDTLPDICERGEQKQSSPKTKHITTEGEGPSAPRRLRHPRELFQGTQTRRDEGKDQVRGKNVIQ